MTPRAHTGLPVDSAGGPTIDPTKNVQDLSTASNQRQDDLREAQNKYMESQIAHVKEMAALRAEHQKELNAKETQRLDSIRAVDQLAVNTAADRQLDAIQALASTTSANAETLRNSQLTMASTIAAQTSATVAGITERISALEKSSYEGAGKQAYSDPMMAQMVMEIKALRESTSARTGKSEGIGLSWGVVVAVVGIVIALVSLMYKASQSAPPQVIEVPRVTK